jgi:hypothetical protein
MCRATLQASSDGPVAAGLPAVGWCLSIRVPEEVYMKRNLPIRYVAEGKLIGLTVLLVLTRPSVVPAGVRAIDWRKIVGSMPEVPVEVVPVEEVAV